MTRCGLHTTAPRGYTIFELLVVLSLLALLAGALITTLTGADEHAQNQINSVALGEIKKACQRFRADMGEAPRHISELIQTPARPLGHSEYDPQHRPDGMGGWWWRVNSEYPEKRLWSFNPSVGRGWSGPYLSNISFRSALGSDGSEGESSYIRADGKIETARSNGRNTPQRRMALVLSNGQSAQGSPVVSDFRFDHSNELNARLHFMGQQSRPRSKPVTVFLEIRP